MIVEPLASHCRIIIITLESVFDTADRGSVVGYMGDGARGLEARHAMRARSRPGPVIVGIAVFLLVASYAGY